MTPSVPSALSFAGKRTPLKTTEQQPAQRPCQAAGLAVQTPAAEPPDTGVLTRLSCLPAELQDNVLRHLPLADILVWGQVNEDFAHRIKDGSLLEKALLRAFGPSFPRAAFSRENRDELLLPWLGSFSSSRLDPDLHRTVFRPAQLFCAVTDTLKNSPQLVLQDKHCFRFSGVNIFALSFTADGRYITIDSMVEHTHYIPNLRQFVLERDGQGWHKGSPFLGEQGCRRIHFSDNARWVAVDDETGAVVVWNRGPQGEDAWQQVARLEPPENGQGTWAWHMRFSSSQRWLLVTRSDGSLRIWNTDNWQLSGSFAPRQYSMLQNRQLFSPDERWLLLFAAETHQVVIFSRNEEGDWAESVAIDPGVGQVATEARFRQQGEQLQLFVRLWNGPPLLMQLREGQWCREGLLRPSEQGVLQVSDPAPAADRAEPQRVDPGSLPASERIGAMVFSPDDRYMATSYKPSGAVLWALNGEGQWQSVQTLQEPSKERSGTLVYFDTYSRWILVGDSVVLNGRETMALWSQDSTGSWVSRPTRINCPSALTRKELAIAADGLHMASVYKRSLHLMEVTRDAMRIRASYPLPGRARPTLFRGGDSRHEIAIDPFCCHLALAAKEGGNEVRLLRVQERPDGATAGSQHSVPVPGPVLAQPRTEEEDSDGSSEAEDVSEGSGPEDLEEPEGPDSPDGLSSGESRKKEEPAGLRPGLRAAGDRPVEAAGLKGTATTGVIPVIRECLADWQPRPPRPLPLTPEAMPEQGLYRSWGQAFPAAAYSRETCDDLLRPWLASFSVNAGAAALEDEAPFRPEVVMRSVSRTLKRTPRLALQGRHSFSLPGEEVLDACFSPGGRYIQLRTAEGDLTGRRRYFVLERDGESWHRNRPVADSGEAGSAERIPFVDEKSSAALIHFTNQGRRVVVGADDSADLLVWDKDPHKGWVQQTRLVCDNPACDQIMMMVLSSNGRALAFRGADDRLRIWRQDSQQAWRQCASFPTGDQYYLQMRRRVESVMQGSHGDADPDVFSADGRWLLLSVGGREHRLALYDLDADGPELTAVDLPGVHFGKARLAEFHHDGGHLRLVAVLADHRLAEWQLEDGGWSEQVVTTHPYGIAGIQIGASGRRLVTRYPDSGALLWSQDAEGLWTPECSLNREAPGLLNSTNVVMDPGDRWLMAGNRFSFVPETFRTWVQDAADEWREQGTDIRSWIGSNLSMAADGQYMAVRNLRGPELMEYEQGRWVSRARLETPPRYYDKVILDPFCCYLVATRPQQAQAVDILRVEEAPDEAASPERAAEVLAEEP